MTNQIKSKILSAIAVLFIFLFVYTASSKLLEFNSFKIILSKSPLIGVGANLVAFSLPVIELLTAVLLFIKPTRRIGFYISFFLMVIFTSYILYMLLFVPKLPCSCGGVLRSMSWPQHFLFNLFFTSLAMFALALGGEEIAINHRNDSFSYH